MPVLEGFYEYYVILVMAKLKQARELMRNLISLIGIWPLIGMIGFFLFIIAYYVEPLFFLAFVGVVLIYFSVAALVLSMAREKNDNS